MSSKRIVGYVISHSGKPGGPWEADGEHCVGVGTDHETPQQWHERAERASRALDSSCAALRAKRGG